MRTRTGPSYERPQVKVEDDRPLIVHSATAVHIKLESEQRPVADARTARDDLSVRASLDRMDEDAWPIDGIVGRHPNVRLSLTPDS